MRDVLSDMLRSPEERWDDAFEEQPYEDREPEEEIGLEEDVPHSHPLDTGRPCRCGECPPSAPPSCLCNSEGPMGLRCRRLRVRVDGFRGPWSLTQHEGRCCAFTDGGEFVEW